MTSHEMRNKDAAPALSSTGKFFVILGIILAIGMLLVDPRAQATNPGVLLSFVGIVLWIISWLRNVLAKRQISG